MKKKIGIVSLYYNSRNYGGLLQSYAMVETVGKMGYNAQQICLQINTSTKDALLELLAQDGKGMHLLSFATKKIREKFLARFERKNVSGILKTRCDKFKQFELSIPHSEKIYTKENVKEACKVYDGFICGSDQIWNVGYTKLYVYALEFVEYAKKKISYAASAGGNEKSTRFLEQLRSDAKKFDFISVREKSAIELFEGETKNRIEVVVDPTLLMTADEWISVSTQPIVKKPYVFCYLLGLDEEVRNAVRIISEMKGLELVTLPYVLGKYTSCDETFGDIQLFDVGPREFLALIKNAELVLTDSFHACAFSLQFEKEFFVFERRSSGTEKSMHNRIADFLDMFGLTERLISAKKAEEAVNNSKKIDFNFSKKVLDVERKRSLNFLKRALSGDEN